MALRSEYRIAGISILVDAPTELSDIESYSKYRVPLGTAGPDDPTFTIELIPEEQFAPPRFDGNMVFTDPMHAVIQEGEKCLHLFRIPNTRGTSAWNWIEPGNKVQIHYHPLCAAYYLSSFGCFNAVGIERVLITAGKYLFHCAYVDDRDGGAVLFSAPSGGGKSTQAGLWEQFAGAETVNGDRAVLEPTETGCIAHGLPVAGSSGVFINRSLPIKAVFIVRKAQEDRAVPMSHEEAFQAIFSQLTINTWNHPFVLSAVDFSMKMAETVPVFRLDCRIDEGAVLTAKAAIASLT